MARLSSSSGITTAKMVATDIFPDLKGAAIMEKFEHVKEDVVEEYGAKVILFRHKKTGAEVMSVSVPDENKVFGITFRTPPSDSTGIPHILEHSVLCGSRKYPVKEPFVELLKGSLNTFLNAFTYPDRTCYPVASQVRFFFWRVLIHFQLPCLLCTARPRILRNKQQHGRKFRSNNTDENSAVVTVAQRRLDVGVGCWQCAKKLSIPRQYSWCDLRDGSQWVRRGESVCERVSDGETRPRSPRPQRSSSESRMLWRAGVMR